MTVGLEHTIRIYKENKLAYEIFGGKIHLIQIISEPDEEFYAIPNKYQKRKLWDTDYDIEFICENIKADQANDLIYEKDNPVLEILFGDYTWKINEYISITGNYGRIIQGVGAFVDIKVRFHASKSKITIQKIIAKP